MRAAMRCALIAQKMTGGEANVESSSVRSSEETGSEFCAAVSDSKTFFFEIFQFRKDKIKTIL